jgi:hypothetical protein
VAKRVTRAERNIAWCERFLRIPEGKNVGKPLKMAPFMKADFRAIYDNPRGTRRAIISRGRPSRILFNLASKMVRQNPDLNTNVIIRDTNPLHPLRQPGQEPRQTIPHTHSRTGWHHGGRR